jgi:hypothetical protein
MARLATDRGVTCAARERVTSYFRVNTLLACLVGPEVKVNNIKDLEA